MLQGFVPVYEGEEKRYKAARLLPGNEYKARVKVRYTLICCQMSVARDCLREDWSCASMNAVCMPEATI